MMEHLQERVVMKIQSKARSSVLFSTLFVNTLRDLQLILGKLVGND